MDIGLRIAYLRRQANLTQAKLADMLHVSPKTVSKWENGYGLPDIKIIPDLAAALGVDADFLLTGRSKSVLAPCERAAAAEAKRFSLSQWAPPPKGVYRLRLRQRTHSNLSGWVLIFAILMLILALIGAPVEVINKEGVYTPFTLVLFLYPELSQSVSVHIAVGWGIAIGIVWVIVFLVFEGLCIVGIASAMNGREDYLDRCAAVQFIGLAAVSVLTFIGCIIVNIYGGEVYMRPSPMFVALIVCACLQWIICRLALMNNKKIGRFKAVSALVLAVTMAASITFAVLPNTIVPTVFAADSVQFSEWNIQLRQDDYEIEGTDFVYLDGYSALVVRSNVKTEYMYSKNATYRCTYADGSCEIRTLLLETEYIKTVYKSGAYYNFFAVNVRIDAPPTASFSDFEYSCYFPDDSAETIFTVKSDSVEILPPAGEEALLWEQGAEVLHYGRSVEMREEFDFMLDMTFPAQTKIFGYASNLSDVQVFYSVGEYENIGGIFEPSGVSNEEILNRQADIVVPAYRVKGEEGYKEEGRLELRLHIRTVPLLQRCGVVRLETDFGPIPLVYEWDGDFLVERYMQSL